MRYPLSKTGRIFDWLIKDADKEWMAENCHLMSWPPKPTVILEVSGWKFYYGTASFHNHNTASVFEPWSELLRTHQEKALAEIARYNEICEKGVDEDFGKAPCIMKVTALKDPRSMRP